MQFLSERLRTICFHSDSLWNAFHVWAVKLRQNVDWKDIRLRGSVRTVEMDKRIPMTQKPEFISSWGNQKCGIELSMSKCWLFIPATKTKKKSHSNGKNFPCRFVKIVSDEFRNGIWIPLKRKKERRICHDQLSRFIIYATCHQRQFIIQSLHNVMSINAYK